MVSLKFIKGIITAIQRTIKTFNLPKRPVCITLGIYGWWILNSLCNGVRIVKIHADTVEFESNGTKWLQKVGDKPNDRWQ
ncbi:MAG: hypothetical protein JXB29_05280 [Sedimentisphaerales bacterium]|nr:hypothetical protein [Sedimentisphaerales bacterium]